MIWNGESHGHSHNPAETNADATGQFTGFKRVSDYWVPEKENKEVKYDSIKYTTKGLSGQITVRVTFKNKEDRNLKTFTFYLDVRYLGLQELEPNENIELDGETGSHPSNHFGTDQLIKAIKYIARVYGEKYDRGEFDITKGERPTHRKLFINDMSLKYGGRFDHKATLKPPHAEHMFGEEVDVQTNEMNSLQRAWFLRNARLKESFGFDHCDGEPSDESPHHFHCSVVPRSERKV